MSKIELEEVLESMNEAVKPHRHTLVQRDSTGRSREDEYDMRTMFDTNKLIYVSYKLAKDSLT